MSQARQLDPAKLLGFDRDGDPLWGVVLAAPSCTAGTDKPAGVTKPVGTVKP